MSDLLTGGEEVDLEIDRELTKRRFRNFVDLAWSMVCTKPLVGNFHVDAICDHLEAVSRGEIRNLIINVPPGMSKSLLTCALWSPWEWTIDASIGWLYFSYDRSMVVNSSVTARKLVESEWYRARWPHVRLRRDQNQKTYYETTAGGFRSAIRTQGAITGRHPSRLVFDDPHDVKGAMNDNKRKGDIEWWDNSVSTRGASLGVRRVGIMQRLGVKDLTGHIKDTDGDNWEFLILPMRYEGSTKVTSIGFKDPREKQGELLAPQLIPESEVSAIERKLGVHHTAGQLQQRPTAREGRLFKPDRLIIVPREEFNAKLMKRVVRAWDKAGTEGAGCFTAGAMLGEDKDGNVWIIDIVKGQWGTDEVERQISLWCGLDEAKFTRAKAETVFEREGGSAGIQAANETVRRNRSRRIKPIKPTGSKEVRAEPLANMINMGQIRMVDGLWNTDLVNEMRAFPDGEFLDQVDACSLAWFVLCDGSDWMPPGNDEEADSSDVGSQTCANPLCDRLRTSVSEYCCASCESSAKSGEVHEHTGECHGRHGQLYARGVWEPNTLIKRK